jgi:carboxymethylenebutenolidase
LILTTAAVIATITGCGGQSPSGDADEHAARMAAEHADDAPVANPMSTPPEELRAFGSEVTYAKVDGSTVTGYLARPESWAAGGPAVIVIHEWWGLNDNIRTMARRLADAGFLALAVDLYGGQQAEEPETARELMEAVDEEASVNNLRQAYGFLTEGEGAGPVASLGWCFGGGWSLRAGLALPDELDAVVIYYGHLITDPERLATLQMPILGHFGEADQGIPLDDVRAFEAALDEVGADATIDVYPGAGHAFANPSGRNYEAEAAETSWQRTIDFLNRSLGSSG